MDDQTRLKPSKGLPSDVVEAAKAVADAGGSPRAQIDAARNVSGAKLGYISHQGARQRQRALNRMAEASGKAMVNG